MCEEFLALQKQVAMKQTRRYDSYYVGGLSEKDAAAYVAKIKRYNIARIQILHRMGRETCVGLHARQREDARRSEHPRSRSTRLQ